MQPSLARFFANPKAVFGHMELELELEVLIQIPLFNCFKIKKFKLYILEVQIKSTSAQPNTAKICMLIKQSNDNDHKMPARISHLSYH